MSQDLANPGERRDSYKECETSSMLIEQIELGAEESQQKNRKGELR